MSYKCEKCGKQIKQRIPQDKIIKERTINLVGDRIRTEIVSEKKVCPNCGKKNRGSEK